MNNDLKLPASLATFFGQPVDEAPTVFKTMPPRDLPGAFNAPELCTLAEGYRPDLMPKQSVAEVKVDGIRALGMGGAVFTREGTPFEAAMICRPMLDAIESAFGRPMMFDGEYVEPGGLEATLSAFRARRGAGMLYLFDAVPFDEWESGRPSRDGLVARKAKLRDAYSRALRDWQGNRVGLLEAAPVLGPCEVEAQAQKLWAQGFEGLVVKDANAPYVRKRSADWLKVKLRTSSEMTVVDVMGCIRGGRETARSLQVRLKGKPEARACLLPVAGGLAETLWANRDHLRGSDVTVDHAGFTGGGQPREATLKRVTI